MAFDKLSPLPKATQPLTEGITPRGTKVHLSRFKAEPQQYGNYISYTDQLDFFAHDPSPKLLDYSGLLADNAKETFEGMDAMALAAGLNVEYAGSATSRSAITEVLSTDDIKRAVTHLRNNKVDTINGYYIAFVHPNVELDISNDPNWKAPHEYRDTTQIYKGELGEYFGVRFIRDVDQYVFRGEAFGGKFEELTVARVDKKNKSIYVMEPTSSSELGEASDKIWINGKKYTIASTTGGTDGGKILVSEDLTDALIETDMKIYPGGGGVDGRPVYGTIIIGKGAFGTSGDDTVQIIAKPLGSAGSADPLNQRGTMGWKGYRVFKLLEQSKMVRIESFASIDE